MGKLATIALEPDEYIVPLPIFQFGGEDQEYHLPEAFCPREAQDQLNQSIENLSVVYY